MPLIVFTHTEGALPRDKAIRVAEEIRESLIRNYAIKTIPDGLRMHTRLRIVETPKDTYFVTRDAPLPLYDVELVGPVDSLTGDDATAFAREVTSAILTAEGAPVDEDNAERVWCVFTEVPDGRWSIGQKVLNRRGVLKHILRYQTRQTRKFRDAAE